ncbi:MAG: hypothetical protein EOP68_15600, partial [Sphingomonas sp.]
MRRLQHRQAEGLEAGGGHEDRAARELRGDPVVRQRAERGEMPQARAFAVRTLDRAGGVEGYVDQRGDAVEQGGVLDLVPQATGGEDGVGGFRLGGGGGRAAVVDDER